MAGPIIEATNDNWRRRDLKPGVDQVLVSFGADRRMLGSDWPVCLLAGSYAEALNALSTVLDQQLSKDQRAAVYGLNAVGFYQLSI